MKFGSIGYHQHEMPNRQVRTFGAKSRRVYEIEPVHARYWVVVVEGAMRYLVALFFIVFAIVYYARADLSCTEASKAGSMIGDKILISGCAR